MIWLVCEFEYVFVFLESYMFRPGSCFGVFRIPIFVFGADDHRMLNLGVFTIFIVGWSPAMNR